jgi:hypothetical protein
MINIGSHNVGRIAERIVANELEARGFRVSDLNKDGVSPNVDLLAISESQSLQIQVKGAFNGPKDRLWIGYGHCTDQILDRKEPMFNRRKSGFYRADVVVLVAVRSLIDYSCFVLPIEAAEEAAQLHLDADFRSRNWKAAKTHVTLEPGPRAKIGNPLLAKERALLAAYQGDRGWDRLLQSH